ncbi:PadR family transcriptional regulator (plasmid) [Clostridium estertheticum]|uniref:PadR family transcriptional regulator n=1 Tax=Clostridium estertheticum TaxID=238834 RepID=A0AA47EN87_9CLOT|nr:PadR family transcriptional regulator [Clostridium estertheticum]MBU3158092.1 PadR family transcriptional regulator [Clostridium estertheticum]MBU3201993.1 PadR family transcriptional regulator [Clostridium estertheticum]WAG63331.1 PadR family transcriptional regulator [Clostridium estertheticum]WAG68236.1 PadR family transcriptional regulator [Clostridium estertheticum]
MEIDKEVLKGHIDSIIISLINEESMYGYALAKKVRDISDNKFELKEGTLYLSLKRLDKNKLIESYWDNDQIGGVKRKYYKITNNGRMHLNNKIKEWKFMKNIIDKFLGSGGGNNYDE